MKKLFKGEASKQSVLTVTIVAVVALLLVGAVFVRQLYNRALEPVSGSQQIVLVDIPSGYSTQEISSALKEKGVIKESWAFEWYVRNNSLREDLKAGTYALRQSQSVDEIVDILAKGVIATDLVTIIPGSRIDQVEATLINSGFKPDNVIAALEPAQYEGHPALVDKPSGASLEGYLFPESFQKNAQSRPSDIINGSLDEMQKRLSPEWRAAVARQGLSGHQAVILASMVEREVSNETDQPIVAQVFLKRLRTPMKLQSDVTVLYGAIADGKEPVLTHDSAYNTFTNDGLPIGPISNVGDGALAAVASPASSDFVFFVAGDDGKTYFSRTAAEHEAAVDAHCKKLCASP